MNCETSKEYMMKYFDGEANEVDEVRFRQHLKTCAACREEFNCMAEIFNSLETEDTVELPEGFEAAVMEKVNALEDARRAKSSKLLVLLYNAATVVSIVLFMIFVADIRQGGLSSTIDTLQEYFGSFSSIASAVFGIMGDMLGLLASVGMILLQVFISIVRTYYYIFIVLIVVLLAVQRLYSFVAARDGRKS